MTLAKFAPTTIWFRSAAYPNGHEEDFTAFLARWQAESGHSFCGNHTGEAVHNGDNWLDLNGEVGMTTYRDPRGTLLFEEWTWDGKGRCLDPGRNTVFELAARK